jgi:hypothetical protein
MAVPLSYELRCGHLPQVFRDLAYRLRSAIPLDTKEVMSIAAAQHGAARRKQGYTAAMLVEESRMLQVTIFQILQNNLANIDFSVLLIGVMTIADEVDSQLRQAMSSFVAASLPRCAACLGVVCHDSNSPTDIRKVLRAAVRQLHTWVAHCRVISGRAGNQTAVIVADPPKRAALAGAHTAVPACDARREFDFGRNRRPKLN